eukprot:m.73114 g.73114  ORF g.73114 m.73114 type:complete len:222 (+) comp10193_c0_seq4:179-844(+)
MAASGSAAPAAVKPSKRAASVDGKQLTLFGLGKVIVLEDAAELRRILKSSDSTDSEILDALRKLDSLAINEITLAKTRVGKTVNALTAHRSGSVRQLAKKLIKKWKSLVLAPPKVRVRPLPPRVISEEERVRKSCLGTLTARLLARAAEVDGVSKIAGCDRHISLAREGETAVWAAADEEVGPRHARVLRALIEKLESDDTMVSSLFEGSTTFATVMRTVL